MNEEVCEKCDGLEHCELCNGTSSVEHHSGNGTQLCPNGYDDDYSSRPVWLGHCRAKCLFCNGTGKKMNATVNFTSKLYSKLGKWTENSFYSPFSLLSALGMCAAGAKGDTYTSLQETLETPAAQKESNEYFNSLIDEVVNHKNSLYELMTANALWIQNGLNLNQSYLETVQKDYKSELNQVDYLKAPENAVNSINNWCNENTKGKIPTIINRQFINKDTLLILTNAIYFKGKWEKPFNPKRTQDLPFNGAGSVPMMCQTDDFPYCETDDFQALELDYQLEYKGDDLSMLVLLPKEGRTLEDNIIQYYENAVDNLQNQEVNVKLPKFKMETTYDLGNVLCDLGADLAFSNKADFSGITAEENLKISSVIHKAFIQVDEEGTEAAAATAVGMMRCTSMRRQINFVANRTFVFFIRNKNTNTILFAGRVAAI